jgi:hypothetical protein
MKERGILFSAEMVRALLDGLKTQTRRVVKLPPWTASVTVDAGGTIFGPGPYLKAHRAQPVPDDVGAMERVHCPYGYPGDRLWVRETWAPFYAGGNSLAFPQPDMFEANAIRYRATPDHVTAYPTSISTWESRPTSTREHPWRPSIFMPRWASRLLLEIVEVRVQRLHDLTEKDALAEGISEVPFFPDDGYPLCVGYMVGKDDKRTALDQTPIQTFTKLWTSINGADSWAANPWVWALTFKRIDARAS